MSHAVIWSHPISVMFLQCSLWASSYPSDEDPHDFVQLAFNLSNGVADTLESSSILIYLETHMCLYVQKLG
jgi:hypothetical protein